MMSSNGNIFRVTGHLCGEFTGSPHKGQWRGAMLLSLICAWINGWVKNRQAGDLRRHCAHYDVIVMFVAIVGTVGSHYVNLQCRQWQQIWHHDNYRFLMPIVLLNFWWKTYIYRSAWLKYMQVNVVVQNSNPMLICIVGRNLKNTAPHSKSS